MICIYDFKNVSEYIALYIAIAAPISLGKPNNSVGYVHTIQNKPIFWSWDFVITPSNSCSNEFGLVFLCRQSLFKCIEIKVTLKYH